MMSAPEFKDSKPSPSPGPSSAGEPRSKTLGKRSTGLPVPHKLPIGIQSFVEMRTGGYLYVDKTPLITTLVNRGKHYFLSRPRRFGKSLLVDTLDCAFSARRELFEGLYLDTPEAAWNWNRKSPVLRIDFSGGTINTHSDLEKHLHRLLDDWETTYSLTPSATPHDHTISPGHRLLSLVAALAQKTGEKVVILVDEYDKPILDALCKRDSSDLESPPSESTTQNAQRIKKALRDFYSAIKPLDQHLRFVLLTGVTKFAKAGIFSGLNNLHDITLTRRYSTLCGYTQEDLETTFHLHLAEFNPEMVRTWYNGYSWTGETVYNPYDILLLFDEGSYRPWWFETGTPTFLVDLLKAEPRTLPNLGSFEIDSMRPETLLFQAGYLTIKETVSNGEVGTWYTLGFPNREVRESFSRFLSRLYKEPEGHSCSHVDHKEAPEVG